MAAAAAAAANADVLYAGSINAYSSRIFRVNGHSLPYAWNHSIIYDSEQFAQMPYLVEQLTARHIDVNYDDYNHLLKYQLTASIDKGLVARTYIHTTLTNVLNTVIATARTNFRLCPFHA